MNDSEREVEIDRQFAALLAGPTDDDRRQAFQNMRELIAQRSQEQIERMEREKGLR